MRKLSFLLIAFLFALSVTAQEKKDAAPKKKWGYFGLKTGLNVTHFRLKNETPGEYDVSWKTGFVFGVFLKIPVAKNFSVQPEFLYSAMGSNLRDVKVNAETQSRYNYFSLPVLLKYKVINKVAIIAGPQFDWLIQGKDRTRSGVYDVTNYLSDHDVLLSAGLEYWPCKCFMIQARYMNGSVNANDRNNGLGTFNQGIQITVGYKL